MLTTPKMYGVGFIRRQDGNSQLEKTSPRRAAVVAVVGRPRRAPSCGRGSQLPPPPTCASCTVIPAAREIEPLRRRNRVLPAPVGTGH
jgi:hypothetical protein